MPSLRRALAVGLALAATAAHGRKLTLNKKSGADGLMRWCVSEECKKERGSTDPLECPPDDGEVMNFCGECGGKTV